MNIFVDLMLAKSFNLKTLSTSKILNQKIKSSYGS